mmetsp:Transcript_3698/g.7082  ORF Transcript_3698/g.7082 Transcript_3698/m.7082 type:complete len:106 (+) Transcript_3698:32-349(+)
MLSLIEKDLLAKQSDTLEPLLVVRLNSHSKASLPWRKLGGSTCLQRCGINSEGDNVATDGWKRTTLFDLIVHSGALFPSSSRENHSCSVLVFRLAWHTGSRHWEC